MNVLNIKIELPNKIEWTKEEIVAAVNSFVTAFIKSRPSKGQTHTLPKTSVSIDNVELSPQLSQFLGIAKPSDSRDWKERKEDYLNQKFHGQA